MLKRIRVLICTALVTAFTFLAVGSALGCPVYHYQPEPPKRN